MMYILSIPLLEIPFEVMNYVSTSTINQLYFQIPIPNSQFQIPHPFF